MWGSQRIWEFSRGVPEAKGTPKDMERVPETTEMLAESKAFISLEGSLRSSKVFLAPRRGPGRPRDILLAQMHLCRNLHQLRYCCLL